MKKLIIVTSIMLLLFLWIDSDNEVNIVCYEDECFNVEIADSAVKRSEGLMFREYLEDGMLFIFDKEGKYSFWMKNTLIPLDIIWIGKDSEIVFISRNVQPCLEVCESIKPDVNALYVLELNAGESSRLGMGVGDGIEIIS
jgi:uncharacterized protein